MRGERREGKWIEVYKKGREGGGGGREGVGVLYAEAAAGSKHRLPIGSHSQNPHLRKRRVWPASPAETVRKYKIK